MLRICQFLLCMLVTSSAYSVHAEEVSPRFSILPFFEVGVSKRPGIELEAHAEQVLRNQYAVSVVPRTLTRQALRNQCPGSQDDWNCIVLDERLLEVGRRLGVQFVLAVQRAAVGRKQMLRMRLADVDSGRVFSEVVELDADEEIAGIDRFFASHRHLFARDMGAEPDQPGTESTTHWSKRWDTWVLVGLGAAVVGTAVTLGVIYGPGEQAGFRGDVQRRLP